MIRYRSFAGSVALAVTLSGCGRAPSPEEPAATDTAPGVSVTAAPGVAFRYTYGFRLPAERIAAAQEVHAAACERLGIARCRITAMRFSRTPDNDVRGELAMQIAPDLSRVFGRDASRAVERSDGSVLDVEITGEDAGANIDAAGANRATAEADRKALDARIASATGTARAELERQRAGLTDMIRAADTDIAGQRASLAVTPMTFRYESGSAIVGYGPRSSFARARDLFAWSADTTFSALLSVLGVLLPPALLAAILAALFLAGRRVVRRRLTPAA